MFKTINAKLFLSIGFVTLIIVSVFGYILIDHQTGLLKNDFFREVNIFSELITRSTHFNMPRENRECIHRMMGIIGNHPGIEAVRMFNNEGKIIFSTNKDEVDKYVDRDAESCNKCHASEKPLEHLPTRDRTRYYKGKEHRIMAMITPIYNEPTCYTASCHTHPKELRVLGVLDIGMSLADLDKESGRLELILIFFIVFTILCFFLIIALFIHRLVSKPVKRLVLATEQISRGELDKKIPVKREDEIGQLAVAFNLMVEELKKAHQEIQSWNIELEKKVEERTQKLNQAREQLIQSEKMASMGVLASSVAHEINNPLQGILTYIKLMLKVISGEEIDQKRRAEFKNYLQLMGDEIERCGGMVKNLLVFSRQSRLDIREADVNAVINNSLKLLDNKIKLQNIALEIKLQENIPLIFCDVKQVQQTLIALLINALEAMPEGGKISVATRSDDSENVEIIIADTGMGIGKEKMRNIFDPFFTTKESAKSTGLGLFVAYGIIKEHKGTIKVKSEKGKGAEFRIKLPVKKTG
ncbi:MAG: HAMP domain-containing protein [Candidatus Aminicenantes bacterium]|nr:HAMP domain-containing protein [Candidatus Aminicenantes bacterium]